MSRAQGTLLTLLLFSLLSSSFSLKTRYADGNIVQLINSTMDWTVNPCDDFFEFSCGGWAKNTTLSPSQSIKYLYNDIIDENNKAFINDVVNDPKHVHVHPFYLACMDLDRINAAGLTPVSSLWESINEVNSPASFSAFLAHLHIMGFPSLFQWIVDIDPNNPPTMILQFQQGGLALPDRSLYSDNDIITAYAQHITNMMVLFGETQEAAGAIAQDVIKFETALASITVPNNNLTDPFSLYNPVDTTQLKSLCPSFDWSTYLTSLTGNSTYGTINLITPTFFSGLSQILFQTQTTTLISYLRWCVAHASATLLTEKISDENFAFFGKTIAGLGAPPARNTTCIGAVDGDLGDLLGVYYARLAFSEQGKSIAREMVVEIEQAMRNRLNGLTWMDDVTRSRALTKLSLIANYIGYPDHLRNISFPVTDDYFSNVIMSNVLTSRRSIVQIGLDADRSIWSMTADTVNAYYDPTRNEMVFPAAILQWPFFDLTIPPEVNYGGTGFTMGHELTHGFDNSGRDYDGQGRLVDWWQASTGKEFSDRVQCVIDQYSTFEVLPGVHIDGKLTQGENVADMGGIKNAYDAYVARYPGRSGQPSEIQGLNNNQLFFVAFAQGWCAVARPEYLRTQVKVDPHSWAKFRVLGTLMNFPEFSEVFQCPVGSVMNPTKRCVVW